MKTQLFKNTSYSDARGQFVRIYDNVRNDSKNLDLKQINLSKNPTRQTFRGMHFQVAGPPEHKFITVVSGSIYLVVSNAHTVSKKSEIENLYFDLSQETSETLFVPSGLATGWLSLSDNVIISYSMTSRFQDCEYSGFCFDDPFADISWPLRPEVISEKDRSWPLLR